MSASGHRECFSVLAAASAGPARAGLLAGVLETPGALLPTVCGSPAHLNARLRQALGQARAGALAVRLAQVQSGDARRSLAAEVDASLGGAWPNAQVILTMRDPSQTPPLPGGGGGRSSKGKGKAKGKGKSSSGAAPTATEGQIGVSAAAANDTAEEETEPVAVTLQASTGRLRTTARDIGKQARACGAAAFMTPCVELDPCNGRKRHEDAVRHTGALISDAVRGARERGGEGSAATAAAAAPAVLAAVVGGSFPDLRRTSVETAVEAAGDSLGGFVLAGMGLGESRAERAESLAAAVEAMPAGLPRVMVGPGDVLSVLDAIRAGVDVIDTDWPETLASFGHALTMRLPGDEERAIRAADRAGPEGWGTDPLARLSDVDASDQAGIAAQRASEAWAEERSDPLSGRPCFPLAGGTGAAAADEEGVPAFWRVHGSVSDPRLALDRRPLVPGCECPACSGSWSKVALLDKHASAAAGDAAMGTTGYSRAYIHHLWGSHELLAQALLEAHNAWRYRQLLADVRAALISGGTALDDLCDGIVARHGLAR